MIASANTDETIVYADIGMRSCSRALKYNDPICFALSDFTKVQEVRQAIPVASQRREDIYSTLAKKEPLIAK